MRFSESLQSLESYSIKSCIEIYELLLTDLMGTDWNEFLFYTLSIISFFKSFYFTFN